MSRGHAPRGMAASTAAAKSRVVRSGRRATMNCAIRRAQRSSPYSRRIRSSSLSSNPFTIRVECGSGVHPHVQGTLAAEAESAFGGVELDARETEVEKDHIRRHKAGPSREGVQVAETTMNDDRRRPVSGQRRSRGLDGGGIAVDPEQPAAWLDPFQDLAGVARLPHGAVDRDRTRLGLEQLYYLL